MEYTYKLESNPATLGVDCIVVGVYTEGELSAAAAKLDSSSQGKLREFMALGDFTGKRNDLIMQYQIAGIQAQRVLLVGLGKKATLTQEALAKATLTAATYLKSRNVRHVVSYLTDECSTDCKAAAVRQSVQAVARALYTFNAYKSTTAEETGSQLSRWDTAHSSDDGDYSSAVREGMAIASGIRLCSDLGNTPPNVCTPTYLAEQAAIMAGKSARLSLQVLEEAQMTEMGMGAFMSVSKGSTQPGKMIILQYKGAADDVAPIALVGKGITFDTGGISLKPGAKMDEMKFDMCGAASVLGTLQACVDLELPLNLLVVVAAAENMPAGNASKPGDVVTTLSGKTVEILNTDAEGRLVLCDALTHVESFKPSAVIDVATLTGACIVALGHHTSGLLSNNDELANELLAAGKTASDEAWQLPLNEKYQEQLQSNFADMANIGSPGAGTITAGCFLARFTENMNWAHLDIAGTAWDGGSRKGATGRPVPLLTQFLLDRCAAHA